MVHGAGVGERTDREQCSMEHAEQRSDSSVQKEKNNKVSGDKFQALLCLHILLS